MSKKASKKVSWIGYITSSIVFFFLLQTFIGHRTTLLDKTFSVAATPLILLYSTCITPWVEKYHHYKNYQALVTERDFYKNKYKETQEELIQHQATYNFDQFTTKLEKFSKRYLKDSSCLCKIIVKRLSNAEQIIIVNAGSRHGVTKNMLAIYGSALVGRVTETYPYYSIVQLITDKNSRVSVYCAQTKTQGIVEGKNNKQLLSLSYVDCLQPIQNNDLLISSGEGMIFPEGFGIGKIESHTPGELHYTITVTPCYDLSTLHYCYLIAYESCSYSPVLKS